MFPRWRGFGPKKKGRAHQEKARPSSDTVDCDPDRTEAAVRALRDAMEREAQRAGGRIVLVSRSTEKPSPFVA